MLTSETEPNNTLGQATILPLLGTDELIGSIANSGDIDFFSRILSQGETLVVRPDANISGGPDPGQLHFAPAVEILDAGGNVLARSISGHELRYMAHAAGTYAVRLFSQHALGNYIGDYGVDVSVTAFDGVTESEPNDTQGTADPLSAAIVNFRGALSSVGDADFFSFSGAAGQAVAIKFAGRTAVNPALRLFNPSGGQVALDQTGTGLHAALAATGTYRFSLQSDNSSGAITGEYAGELIVGSNPVLEAEPVNGFTGAVPWTVTSTTSRAVGTLSNQADVDVYAVDFSALNFYRFELETPPDNLSRQSRILTLYNEFGQLLKYSPNGILETRDSLFGVGMRPEKIGRHFITVQATNETGLGGYSLAGRISETFPTLRDVPLYFHDYTGQAQHLGLGPAAPFSQPAVVPQLVGMFEARYDIYDVDVTQTNPGVVEHVSFGMGEFGEIGAYGFGLGDWGERRADGGSLVDETGAGWDRLASVRFPASVMNQETGHGSGLYAHARNPLAFMAYDNQAALNVVGSYFPFPWVDSRVPDVEVRNERDFQDWALQAGRLATEAEPNGDSGTAQNLDPLLAQMTGDGTPRNDRVTIAGRISSDSDADTFHFTAAAGQTFAFDIDSAEFQNPLDATLSIFNSAGGLVATSTDALDRDSGLFSVDPYLVQQFTSPGDYYVQITSSRATTGYYRLKFTPSTAFDTAGPRVISAWPNGGSSQDSTRQLIFWLNDQLDPATLTSSNIIVSGPGGTVTGAATFDPLDASLVWTANAPLAAGAYTVTFQSGATGIKDLRGNPLDGETSGTLAWPSISGNGVAGGNFVNNFTISGPDTVPAQAFVAFYRRHPYNRGSFTVLFDDELDILSVYNAGVVLRGDGPDNTFNTADDTLAPTDVLYDKIVATDSRELEVYARGIPDADNYRLEATFLDAAGHTVNLSQVVNVPLPSLMHGPAVIDVNVQPGTVLATGPSNIQVTFSGNINTSTLTTSSFVVRKSVDPTFFDGNDVIVGEADGAIGWDPVNRRATFQPATALLSGYYLIELEGDTGGIVDTAGRPLDGEYLDSNLQGSNLFSLWRDSPSGDGRAGGDYRAFFSVESSNTPPSITDIASQTISVNQSTGPLSFTIGDAETPLASLSLTGVSSNTTLVPNGNIVFGGSGANRTVTVTPALNRSGTATITVTVTDANGATALDSFQVTVQGPSEVISHTPLGVVSEPVSSVEFHFNQAMDTASFSFSDVVSFRGPGGNLLSQFTGFEWVDADTLRVAFFNQVADGDYSLVIGPQILGAASGLPMDQDGDGASGEAVDDRYTATFAIDTTVGPDGFGYAASAAAFEAIDLELGTAGVFSILDGVDDGSAAVDLGANTFNFYGTSYAGPATLFVSSNGLITFSGGVAAFNNSDLTNVPSEAAIAPLWDDWLTNFDAIDRVLGKFEDTNGDAIIDRLIIEWSNVRNFSATSSPATFQAILQLNTGLFSGDVVFNYPDLDVGTGGMGHFATQHARHGGSDKHTENEGGGITGFNDGASATIGIKDALAQGPNRLLVSFNNGANPFVGSGQAIRLSASTLVGVDFGPAGNASPKHWTLFSGPNTPDNLNNLLRENGATTAIDLTLTVSDGVLTSDSGAPAAGQIPAHGQPLSGIAGNLFDDADLTAVWSDLVAGQTYEVFVFGLDTFAGSQMVTITGAGSPLSFTQSYNQNQLIVNDEAGASTRTLGSYAELVTADALGRITVLVQRIGPFWGLGGLAIRPTVDITLPVASIVGPGSVLEGDSSLTNFVFNVTLSSPSSQTVTVQFATVDGTATAGDDDYIPVATSTLTFQPGVTLLPVAVQVRGDTKFELNETFNVLLSSPANATLGTSSATATIANDDPLPTLFLFDRLQAEGTPTDTQFVLSVTLSNPSSQPVTVTYATAAATATSGTDFTPTTGTLTFSPMSTSQAVTVTVKADLVAEQDEVFFLSFSNPINAVLQDNQALGAILNDDSLLVTGADSGGGPHVRVFHSQTLTERFGFFAYNPNFNGGVRVATGDLNNDGMPDIITAAGPGGGPHIRAFHGLTGAPLGGPLGSFFAYGPSFSGGVFLAAGDVNNDGQDDIITGAGPGAGPHVKVFSGADGAELYSFYAFGQGFSGGVSVAAADVNRDGFADIITGAGPGAGPHVKVFSGMNGAELFSFYAYGQGFGGGVYVAAGDVNGDGRADIFTGAGAGAGPHVRVFSGLNLTDLHSFYAYDPNFSGGARVAAGDLDLDGLADIITGAGPGGGPHVRGFSGLNLAELTGLFAYNVAFSGGVFVAGATLDRSVFANDQLTALATESLASLQLSSIQTAALQGWELAGLSDSRVDLLRSDLSIAEDWFEIVGNATGDAHAASDSLPMDTLRRADFSESVRVAALDRVYRFDPTDEDLGPAIFTGAGSDGSLHVNLRADNLSVLDELYACYQP